MSFAVFLTSRYLDSFDQGNTEELKQNDFESKAPAKNLPKIDPDSNFMVQIYQYLKYLISKPMWLILVIFYVLGNCSIVTIGSLINILSTNFGFPSVLGSIVALGVIFIGLTSSVLYSIFFIRRKRQTNILSSYGAACVISLVGASICATNQ